MKKKLISVFLCAIISLSFAGCGFTDGVKDGVGKAKKENSESENKKNVVAVKKDIEKVKFNVDWEKCIEDTKTELTNPKYFDYVKDIYIKVEDERITFTAALADSANNDVALDFSDTILRRFNANAQMQDSSIKGGSKDYLGGIYDVYDITIGIAPLSKTKDQNKWYVYDAIAKSVQREPKLKK
ncbi:hypothetical protein LGL08_20575 [Clostridium estertheticum]|uniref:hypothetical protein n=1 Tax=Clostridium estertheticum TaxID=238834 RepID=UPI001CF197E3|nr:hypothetical protein [Clostridium estertheticum]MCB2308821.1 hypothetical protein [Clostridium estertheticum]MCB2347309.1 hypothetical protein [Clostridium estertheticum]MCB2351925.1 hypothetical protein [Clostridium estertheticum]WAG48508.1 hypothetical protein LL127_23225 [Clostridium estertheticum]